MKQMKRMVGLLLTVVMVVAMTATAFASEPKTYSIKINNSAEGHIYEAYQIFSGDLNGNTLSNVQWGSGVTPKDSEVKASDVAARLDESYTPGEGEPAKLTVDNLLDMITLTKKAADSGKTSNPYVISGLEPGYYLVQDAAGTLGEKDDVYTSYILKVVKDVEASPKSAKPTVDKQVLDEEADAEAGHTNGWGETADHAIYESFQFKLTATLPADPDYAAYEKYEVVFHDLMSTGITFESIESVKVGNTSLEKTQYTCTADAGQEGGDWRLTIADIKAFVKDLTAGTTVEVIYNAHLNEDASVGNSPDNKNTVHLRYSNNPNVSGTGEELGKTQDDHVWVFTYDVNNTKVDEKNEPLSGAGFKLYSDAECKNEVALVYDELVGTGAYRPIEGEEVGAEMFSAEGTGKFHIVGLDAGTYYLKETTTPAGYNTCDVIPVIISATHAENTEGNSASVTFTENSNLVNTIVNRSGATLPETGGMGTTIFYVLGAVLVIGAGVVLVTRRRMNNR